MSSMYRALRGRWWVLLVAIAVVALSGAALVASRQATPFVQRATMGDLEVIHSRVSNNGALRLGVSRLAAGDRISTETAGRAKLHLADGITALLDAQTEIVLAAGRIELLRGRLFIDTPEGRTLRIAAGAINAPLSSSKVAFDRAADGHQTKLFCAQGEVMASALGATTRIPSGETLTLSGGKVNVAPEKAFEDWTGGLAVPWSGRELGRSAVADVWVTNDQGDPTGALHVSSERIDVTLHGEFAVTHTLSRYYNGNDVPVTPNVRLALPPNALLTRVAHRQAFYAKSHDASLAICHQELSSSASESRLEWAGNGWISGTLPQVPAGGSIDLELDWSEWLVLRSGRASYRYPMGQKDDGPFIGELSVQIDAQDTGAESLEANRGATVDGKKLRWRAADLKPSDDWVVSFAPALAKPNIVRAYVERASDGSEPYVLFRTETNSQAATGIQLAIVVDSSRSVGLSGLELARQVVDALLGNLSESDRVVVIAADENQRTLGSATPSANTAVLRQRIYAELAQLRPGGASDLAKSLERAADSLDASETPRSNRLVVYLGDGRPSLGELTADRIRSQLQRRGQGIPRMAGVAIGPNADRWLLARLVAGSGPVHTVLDRSEAAQVASSIVAAAEETTDREVSFDLGTNVDRIYPREGRALPRGSTAMVIARLRGTLPRSVTLSYRDGSETKTETRPVEHFGSLMPGELGRRWALARIEEIVGGDEGIEPALLLAKQHQLLMPWTTWVLEAGASGQKVACSKFSRRIVELSTMNDTPYARRIEELSPPGGGWLEPPLKYDPGDSMEQGAAVSGRARISTARASMAACRDTRAHSVADLPEQLHYQVGLRGNGSVERVTLTPIGSGRNDRAFLSCIDRVIRAQSFVGAERPIAFEGTITLPPARDPKRTHCSLTSRLPLLLRRTVWAHRSLGDAVQNPETAVFHYEQALRSCETATWSDRRALLLELIGEAASAARILELAQSLSDHGHADSAEFLRNEALRRVKTPEELTELRRQILSSEPNLDADLAAKLKRANTNEGRLLIVQKALGIAPHSPLGRRLQLLLLQRLGDQSGLLRVIEELRNDPFTDAGLVALSATALNELERAAEARRTFSELFERAPRDPWVLAFAGDQLRMGGFGEQAIAAYSSLERVVPNDTTNLLRSGLAQAGAGRIDIATRLLDRAAQTAGRSDDSRLNELAAVLRAVTLARARAGTTDPTERLELGRRLAQTALPDMAAIVLVEAPTSPEQGLTVRAYRGDDKSAMPPELDASPLGIAGLFVDRGAQSIKIVVSRRTLAGLAPAMPVTVSTLRLGDDPDGRQLRSQILNIPADAEQANVTLAEELRP